MSAAPTTSGAFLGVDIGGTFTDVVLLDAETGRVVVDKTLSTPSRPLNGVRTGVTAILPRGKSTLARSAFAGVFSLNGNGEMTGTHWIEEAGMLEGPVMLTNTHSVGVVRDAVIQWRIKQGNPDASGYWWSLPVVAETWDGDLNDVNGFHVKPEHVFAALESAHGGEGGRNRAAVSAGRPRRRARRPGADLRARAAPVERTAR